MIRRRQVRASVLGYEASVSGAEAEGVGPKARLAAAADALGIEVGPATTDKLFGFLELLGRWNRVFNLTSLREPEAMWVGHLLDCLAIVPALRRHAAGHVLHVLDAGSGGGLPGVVLAIMQPSWRVVCVDASAKKASFLRQVGLHVEVANLRAVHSRVEALPDGIGPFDLVVSRAFASVRDFTQMTEHALAPGGTWVAMKARPDAAELSELSPDVELFHVEQVRVPGVEVDRCLVWMRRCAPDKRRYLAHGEDLLHR